MYDNEFETEENKIWTKDKIEPQHIHWIINELLSNIHCYWQLSIFISKSHSLYIS